MKRRDILKTAGLASLASILPFGRSQAAKEAMLKLKKEAGLDSSTCVLIPAEEVGPYPWDLSSNSAMYRTAINETQTGIPLNLTLTLVNINDNCNPIVSARVDIWHCNKDGYYSEYANQPGYLGTLSYTGDTFCRGIQLSDANGQVQFTTIYPGWYAGRAHHFHLRIYLNSVLTATTQIAFADSLNTTIDNSALYSAHGQDNLDNETDHVFGNASTGVIQAQTQYVMLNTAADSITGGYDGTLTIGIGVPTTGIINLSPETGGQFKLGQNYPNAFDNVTTIPFTLTNASHVRIELFDSEGQKVMDVIDQRMNAGDQTVTLDKNASSLVIGNYVYQITVENSVGTFRQAKSLTVK